MKRISDIIKKSNKKKRTPVSKFFHKLLLLPLICIYSVVHAFYLLFLSPYHSFNFEAKQRKNSTYKHSYHEHLKLKRGVRAYTIALGLGIISLIYFVDLSTVAFSRQPLLTKEARAASVSWDSGGVDNDWETKENWSDDTVPDAADDVLIDYNETININGTTTVNSLTLGGTNPTILNFDYDAITSGALNIDEDDLTVESNGTITHTAASSGSVVGSVYIDVQTGDATMAGAIDVSSKGYISGYGTGKGTNGNTSGGGGYGGTGGDGYSGAGGSSYGSVTAPVDLGCGGGTYCCGDSRGGGAARLTVEGEATISGHIHADGGNHTSLGAGGSGGSIYLSVGTLSGAGTVTVNGATGNSNAYGDGGGGRIAIYYDTDNSSSITKQAYGGNYGGTSTHFGGAGTIYIKDNTAVTDTVIIDNNSKDSTGQVGDFYIGKTPLSTASYNTCTISNDGHLALESGQTLTCSTTLNWTGGNITDNGGSLSTVTSGAVVVPIGSYLYANSARTGGSAYTSMEVNGTLTHSQNYSTAVYRLNVETTGNFNIASGGSVNVTSRGFFYEQGDGHGGGDSYGRGSGGGHGGQGAGSVWYDKSLTYGSITNPITLGSGGGGSVSSSTNGGGAVQLTVGGTLTMTGTIVAVGTSGSEYGAGGGSIYLDVDTIDGAGAITADGSTGSNKSGGGGRVALYYDHDTYSSTPTAYGGYNASYPEGLGGAGTVYINGNLDAYENLIIDNNSHNYTISDYWIGRTPLTPSGTPLSLTIDTLTISNDGNLLLNSDTTIDYTHFDWTGGNITDRGGILDDYFASDADVVVPDGSYLFADTTRTFNSMDVHGVLTHSQNYSVASYKMDLTTTNNFTIQSDASINAVGKGFYSGYGDGKPDNNNKGASYGGQGYNPSATSGLIYGSLTAPTDIGSSGSCWYCDERTIWGGGAVKLTVGGNLILSGSISANANDPSGGQCDSSGGGSGGSVYLDAATLQGAGTITVRGGNPCNTSGEGGGGGRIAIYYDTNSSTITPTAYGGWITGGTYFGGAGTVYWKDNTLNSDLLVIDNGSHDDVTNGVKYYGKTPLTNSGTPASFTFDAVTISNDGHLLLNSDTTITSTTNTWTGGNITDSGGTWASMFGASADLNIPTSAILYADTTRSINSLDVDGTMTTSKNTTAETYKIVYTTTGDATIGATGTINVDGKGYNGGYGDGHGHDAGTYGSGGGYGGRGGNTSDGGDTGGATYGSETAPSNIGSGGMGSTASNYGSSGGGAVKLTVGGNMSVGGTISANGGSDYSGSSSNYGGGSGGSVWAAITGSLTGSANITTNGSSAQTANAGAGGGGRIYISTSDDSYGGSLSVIAGTTGYAGEAGTSSLIEVSVADTPSFSSPLNNSYNNSLTPTMTGSAYVSDITHNTTDWKIVASTDTCSDAAVWESEHDAVNLTSITVGAGLSNNTTYKSCVRYTNDAGDSDWGSVTFTTEYDYPSTDATWHFNEAVVGDNYDYNNTYVELDASSNSLARLKDQGAGVYKGAPLLNYTKRKEITVTNATASELTNYQVKLDVLYDADMQADFDDLRFTTSNGTTEIDYWLESKTDSSRAVVWVEVPTISASSSATIYMYYGNATVSSGSSGDNTFIFFDDFNRDDSTSLGADWSEYGDGNWQISSNTLYRPDVSSGTIDKVLANVDGSLLSVTDTIIDAKVNLSTVGGGDSHIYLLGRGNALTTSSSREYALTAHVASTTLQLLDENIVWKASTTTAQATGEWWNWRFQIEGNNIRGKSWILNTPDSGGWSVADTATTNNSGYVGMATYNTGTAAAYFDDFRVRQNVSSEPIIAWTEESSIALADWSKRQIFTVFNNTASELTNYQVRIPVSYDADMQADFDDIRFTSSNGTSLIDYWLESKTDSTRAYFWVEVPSVGASSSANIYMYYGNAGVSSASSGTDTFEFFDDFSGDLSKWVAIAGTFDTTGGTLNYVSGAGYNFIMADSASSFTNYAMDYDLYAHTTMDNGMMHRSQAKNNADNVDVSIKRHPVNTNYFHHRVSAGWGGILNSKDYTFSDNVWMYMSEIFSGTTLNTKYYTDQEKTALVASNSYTEATWTSGYVGLYNYETSTGAKIDNFRIRKYATIEPTLVPGGIENNSTFSDITVSPSLAGTHPTYTNLLGISATTGTVEGSIGYNISDNGTDWYYHNGAAWTAVTSEPSQYNTIEQVNAYLINFPSEIGTGDFYFKAFLISDTTEEVELDSITLEYDATANAPTLTMSDSTRTPAMSGSAYSGYGEHQSSDWTISTSNSCVSNIVWSKDNDAVNKTSITANSTNGTFSGALAGKTRLTANTSYYACVRYASPGGDSDWSTPVNFTSAANNVPPTPTNSLPINGATDQSKNATLTASAFSDSDSDPHTSSDWYVYESSDCSGSAIWQKEDSGTNLTSIDIDSTDGSFQNSHAGKTDLKGHTQYSFKVRYSDDQTSGDSSYSSCTNFTTLNTSPALDSSIPTQNLTEDVNTPNAFDLDTYFSDADWNDNDLYTCTATNDLAAALGTMTINGDQTIDFTLLANATGTDTIQFSCEDLGSASTASNSITVNVSNVNDAPTFAGIISVMAWDEDTTKTNAFDLDTYFTDIDPGDSCTYTVPTDPANITVSIDGDNKVSFTPDANYNGNQTVKFRCTDTGLATVDSNDITLTVDPVNDTPIADAGVDINTNESAGSVALSGTGSDVDTGDVITYAWTEVSDSGDGCSLDNNTSATPTVTLLNKESSYDCVYSLTVNDGTVDSGVDQITIHVTASNDAPTFVTDINDSVTVDEGDTIVLPITAADVDSSAITLDAVDMLGNLSNINELFTDHGNKSGTFTWHTGADDAGTYQVRFDATDAENTVSHTLDITVNNVSEQTNTPPYFVGSLPNVSFYSGITTAALFDLNDYFADAEGDVLTYSATGNEEITVNIEEGIVTMETDNNYSGQEAMNFIAEDPSGETATSNAIIVTVSKFTESDIDHITGTNRGRGIIKVWTKNNELITSWQAFGVGGVIPRLAAIKNNSYIFAIKKRSGTTLHAYTIRGRLLAKKRLSPKLHWRKIAIGDLDGRINTEETAIATKRASSIYFKIYSFNPDSHHFTLEKRSKFKYVRKDYRLQIEDQNVIVVLNGKGKEVYRWKPF
ncbi:MAG: DUF2341 domain-containing protein [Patescibacteria group bacterium]